MLSRNIPSLSKRYPADQGFTLVATILVISLLTVLIVAATVSAQIEEQAQYNASREEIARQNALYGLNQALNALQTAAGPDRRATARADIITPNMTGSGTVPTTGPSNLGYGTNYPATDAGQSFWTGVWKTTSNDYSGCAGNGSRNIPMPDASPTAANVKGPGPGGSFLYYDFTPDGNLNSASAQLDPATPPSRSQLYDNANVTWLISWPYSQSFSASPDPTLPLGSGSQALPNTLPTRSGSVSFPFSTANPAPTNANVVTIAANLGIKTNQNYTNLAGGTVTNYINAPKVPILAIPPGTNSEVAVGTFAYWISDEGIKAKVNLQDPFLGTSPGSPAGLAASQAHFQIAQAGNPAEALILNSGANGPYNELTANDLRQQTTGTMPVIAPTLASMAYADINQTWSDFETNTNTYSPDFTVYSYGLLADNFNGGLRKDLTAALENPRTFQNQFSDGSSGPYGVAAESMRKLYSMDAIMTGFGSSNITDMGNHAYSRIGSAIILDGLRWDSLYYYYNIYHSTLTSPINVQSSPCALTGIGSNFSAEYSGTVPTLTARQYQEPDPGGSGAVLDMDGFMPHLAYWNYNISIGLNYVRPDSTTPTSGDYDFIFGQDPVMVFYNPFNIALQEPAQSTLEMTGDMGEFGSGSINQAPPPDSLVIKSGSTVEYPPAGQTAYIIFPNSDVFAGYDGTPFIPGELRVYGLSQSSVALSQSFIANQTNNGFPMPIEIIPYGTNGTTSPNFTQFLASTNTAIPSYPVNPLVSTKFSPTASQQEEITMGTSVLLPGGKTHTLSIYGHEGIGSSTEKLNRNGYLLWPNSTTTGTISSGNVNAPSLTWQGVSPTLLGKAPPAPLSLPTNTINYVTNFEDRLPGTYDGSFNPARAVGTPIAFGLPGFASGGPLYNPLNTDENAYTRDFTNSGRTTAPIDLHTQVRPSSQITDTGWLPASVGKSTTIGNPSKGTSTNIQQILYDVPRQPLLSLGHFKNMYVHYCGGGNFGSLGFSFYTLGGSYQAGLPTNVAFVDTGLNGGAPGTPAYALLLDDNFLANETLFDGYFLSTIPPATLPASDYGNWPIDASQFANSELGQSYVNSDRTLPNSRLVYYCRPQSAVSPAGGNPPSSSFAPNIEDLQCQSSDMAVANLRKPAANLLINGAFNINSTSVPAWTSLLLSTGAKNSNLMALFSTNTSGTASILNPSLGEQDVPFFNFSLPYGALPWAGAAGNNVPWYGLVDLKNTTVQTLAKNIVAQVLARGPFLSLGDFLNHRLTSYTAPASGQASAPPLLSASGALQTAIDQTNINQTVAGSTPSVGTDSSTLTEASVLNTTSTFTNTGTPPPIPFPSSLPPSINPPNQPSYSGSPNTLSGNGIPGTLLQNDLVQAIAPVIAARSDTFTIRAYGQALSPTGNSEAEAYCEAVVQRVPEYVYSSENGIVNSKNSQSNYAYDDPSPSFVNTEPLAPVKGLSSENSTFGRRFKIISIRWLNKSEI